MNKICVNFTKYLMKFCIYFSENFRNEEKFKGNFKNGWKNIQEIFVINKILADFK